MYMLLLFYGFFLIACGITAVIFIGSKAKTALVSGGTSGILAIFIGYFYYSENILIKIAAILLPSILFVVFCWRSSKTFLILIDMISAQQQAEAKKKGIAFLIISLMAIVSLVVAIFQL